MRRWYAGAAPQRAYHRVMVAGPAVPPAPNGPSAPLPPRVGRAVARMAAELSGEARRGPSPAPAQVAPGRRPPSPPALRTLVLGMPDWRTLTGMETVLGPADVVVEPRGPVVPEIDVPPGGFDVGVALRWLSRLDDPDAGLAALRQVAPRHLLVAAPREPFGPIGVRMPARLLGRGRSGRRWSGSDFLRLVSRHGAVRDVAHPTGFILVWLRRS